MTAAQEKLANKCLVELITEEPVKLIQFMLAFIGKEMVASNAATMDMNQESDINKVRYKIECKCKITKVKVKYKSQS